MGVILGDKAGRKVLLVTSGLGMFVSNMAMFLNQNGLFGSHLNSNVMPVLAVSLFYICFTFGFGGVPFVLLGEIFPSSHKSFAVSVSLTFIWVLNIVNTKTYYWQSDQKWLFLT